MACVGHIMSSWLGSHVNGSSPSVVLERSSGEGDSLFSEVNFAICPSFCVLVLVAAILHLAAYRCPRALPNSRQFLCSRLRGEASIVCGPKHLLGPCGSICTQLQRIWIFPVRYARIGMRQSDSVQLFPQIFTILNIFTYNDFLEQLLYEPSIA
jgi:hypothetical protein